MDKERHIPELYKLLNAEEVTADGAEPKYEEAILDVVARAPAATYAWWWDVTIRSPHAQRNVHAHEVAAEAAQTGIRDKETRYGVEVAPLSYEPYGRLHQQSDTLLRMMAEEMAAIRGTRPSVLAKQWRQKLERALITAQADVTLLCLGRVATDLTLSARGAAAAAREAAPHEVLEPATIMRGRGTTGGDG